MVCRFDEVFNRSSVRTPHGRRRGYPLADLKMAQRLLESNCVGETGIIQAKTPNPIQRNAIFDAMGPLRKWFRREISASASQSLGKKQAGGSRSSAMGTLTSYHVEA